MQGSVWGSLCCVVLMDKLGKLVYSRPELLYYYKGVVEVPTLQMVDDILGIQKCSSQATQLNTVINTFMDLEKLTLSKNKCHRIHIGKACRNCPVLKVHDTVMHDSSSETYLGDRIHKSGTNKLNIDTRIAKGFGRVKTILAMLKESPLGWTRIKSGLILRQAMLINGIMFNSESWHGVTQEDVHHLQQVDESLLRGLVLGHASIAIPALYLELGALPLKYIWASRRIMYLQTILKRNKTELTKKMYLAQKSDPKKGDFYDLVKKDIEMVKLYLNEDEIESLTKKQLKQIVKTKVNEAAFIHLMELKSSKSKLENIQYTKYELSPYMRSPQFTQEQASVLLALRTRTVRGVRSDFGDMFVNKHCPLGCDHIDTLPNILSCSVLQDWLPDQRSSITFLDCYSKDVQRQKDATNLFMEMLEMRDILLEEARQLG